ncbi:hypothetical protein [Candidatus Tokpelaia sp.]|uniref:hypothetical protein n=1 Tax=Candidatus Tokpelaia sp. TaxID=2233777 RepID=UPI0012396273|nr:hypothetical protein [Candidatus Tokpelaia sp.]KAA6405091.1 hypothetical protein DPQ22_05890 [Candidatus Tokpelaia sp.]
MQLHEFDTVLNILGETQAAYAVLNQADTNPTFLFSLEKGTLICREAGYKIKLPLKEESAAEYIDKFTFSKEEWSVFLAKTPIIDQAGEDENFYYGYQRGDLIFRIQKTDSSLI